MAGRSGKTATPCMLAGLEDGIGGVMTISCDVPDASPEGWDFAVVFKSYGLGP